MKRCLPITMAMVMAMAPRLAAHELPIRSYTVADGLADNRVNRIVVDSRGMLWMCTGSGISRFDGSHFQSFGVADGLPYSIINDLLETPDGDFWLASNGSGVIRVRLGSTEPRYEAFSVDREPTANRVNRLFRANDGAVWVGTDGGLFRMTVALDGRPAFTRTSLRRRGHPDAMVQVWSFAQDREGTLWVGTRFGLVSILRDGRIVSYPVRTELETDHVLSLIYTPDDDLLWIGHQSGLALFRPPPAVSYRSLTASDQALEDRSIVRASARRLEMLNEPAAVPHAPREAVYFETSRSGVLPAVTSLLRSHWGAIRIVAGGTVFEFSGGRFVKLEDPRLNAGLAHLGEDREGNLWVSKRSSGVLRVARHGFITFRESDGVGPQVGTVFEDRTGEVVATSEDWRVSRFDGARFQTVRANIPARARGAGWAANQKAIEDHLGDWWFATGAGVVRFSGIRRVEDLEKAAPTTYTTRDGLAQDSTNRLFEDSRGDVWIASLIPGREVLTRWDRASGRFQRYSDADGLRAFNAPTGFHEDAHHILFITFRDGGIARYDGRRFEVLSHQNGLAVGQIGGTMAGRAGRLWFWSSLGVCRIDDLNARQLQPIVVVPQRQLRTVSALVEDARGSVYVANAEGIARIDGASTAAPSANLRIASLYNSSDGLAGTEVTGAYADRAGRLWFSTTQGLSYYDPEIRDRVPAPRVRIGGLRIAGIDQRISPAGEDRVADLELGPGRSQLEIAFFGIDFTPGNTLSFDYRLLGAGDDWSAPSPLRSVMFSNLAPGRYQFEVRAVSAAGERSPQPARAAFRVLPPVWRRWWFITLVGLVVLGGMTAFEFYRAANRREISRAREERLAALEQVRRRIAADLHDEIGSSLTQISILSEVALQQGTLARPDASHALSMIAASSRELVDAMSDIVWAINPAKDHLADLAQRMRRLAADTFTATNTALRIDLPSVDDEIALGANVRREVFLIFKETVNNIVKHSACTEVVIRLAIGDARLRLELCDNGRGFDPHAPGDGHGLASLRNRAASLGGSLAVVSAPGSGTSITLDLPL